ncbi:MAG: PH domain-containing protein [Candidatus Bathyarchaeia archaeon]
MDRKRGIAVQTERRKAVRTRLQEGEQVIHIARKHWVVYLVGATVAVAIAIVAELIKLTWWGIILGMLVMLYIHFERKFNIWVVTDRRFIDEEGIISFYAKETPLDKINNITFSKDVPGRILGYGTIYIQSAAEFGQTKAGLVTKPELLQAALIRAQEQFAVSRSIPPDSTICPVCKEVIKKGALKCRFCGTVFEETKQQQGTVEEPPDGTEKDTVSEKIFERRGQLWRP